MIRAYINENHSIWDLLLPYVTMVYRAIEHETTGTSPNMLMFAHNTRTPLDLIHQIPPNVKSVLSTPGYGNFKIGLNLFTHLSGRTLVGQS